MLNNSVLIEVLRSVALRLAKHTEKLKHTNKLENTIDILTLIDAKDTENFFKAYHTLPPNAAKEVLANTIARLTTHAALWPNDGDLQVLLDAESFFAFGC